MLYRVRDSGFRVLGLRIWDFWGLTGSSEIGSRVWGIKFRI
jgi:hypothetical protein